MSSSVHSGWIAPSDYGQPDKPRDGGKRERGGATVSEAEVLWQGEVRSKSEHKTTVEKLRVARNRDGEWEVQVRRRDEHFGRVWWESWNVSSSSHGPDLEDAAVAIAHELRDLREAARAVHVAHMKSASTETAQAIEDMAALLPTAPAAEVAK